MDLIISLGWLHGRGSECNWVPMACFILLEEGSSGCKSRGINFEACGAIRVPKDKDRRGYKSVSEGAKGYLLWVFPFPRDILLG